jgi:hypothetical protein
MGKQAVSPTVSGFTVEKTLVSRRSFLKTCGAAVAGLGRRVRDWPEAKQVVVRPGRNKMRLMPAAILLPLLSLPILGCHSNKPAAKNESPIVQPENVAALKQRRAIIFIHGIHGSSDDTWRVSPSGPNWPDLMQTDSQFTDAEIFKVGYPSPFFRKQE